MKKYFLTFILSIFAFIGFTFATDYTIEGMNDGIEGFYNPDSIFMTEQYNLYVKSFECTFDNCYIKITDGLAECEVYYHDGGDVSMNGLCDFFDGDEVMFETYGDVNLYSPFDVITFGNSLEGGDNGEGGEGGGSGGDDVSGGLLPGGTGAFSGIISSLGSAVSEFIPYVAYIGIGLLSSIIGFVAIKRLINRVRAKIYGTFNSGRRK